MLKTTKKIAVIVFIFIVLLIVGSNYMRERSPLFNFVFPPSDLYENLAEVEINLSNKGEVQELSFEPKYPGNHAVFIDVSKVVPVGKGYGGNFLIKVEISNKSNQLVLNDAVSEPAYSFWRGEKAGGLALLVFSLPEDLPLKQTVHVNITILKSDSEFQERLGPLELAIRKYSDE